MLGDDADQPHSFRRYAPRLEPRVVPRGLCFSFTTLVSLRNLRGSFGLIGRLLHRIRAVNFFRLGTLTPLVLRSSCAPRLRSTCTFIGFGFRCFWAMPVLQFAPQLLDLGAQRHQHLVQHHHGAGRDLMLQLHVALAQHFCEHRNQLSICHGVSHETD